MPKNVKENHRVELVDGRYTYNRTEEQVCSELAYEIKNLITEHQSLQGVRVYHTWDMVVVCMACGKPLEYMSADHLESDEEENTLCAWCGEIA